MKIEQIRAKIKSEYYEISSHADEEMLADDLELEDLENAILKGYINRRFTRDPRGIRYEIIGPSFDERKVGMICRIMSNKKLLIITVYVREV